MLREYFSYYLAVLLTSYEAHGGVLEFLQFECDREGTPEAIHRDAAARGMSILDRSKGKPDVNSQKIRYERFLRDDKLEGKQVPLAEFWGTDDVEPKNSWSLPEIDGYKSAFFHPPYGLRGTWREKCDLFTLVNSLVLGTEPEKAEIFSWSTDWNSYFDDGHEGWGAYFWTIRANQSQELTVVGASSTD
jgi:hypothetical protein